MRVALVQMNSQDNKAANVMRALDFVADAVANGAQFILLPEYFSFRGRLQSKEEMRAVAETIPGASSYPFMEVARRNKVYILLGSMYEMAHGNAQVHNTSVLIDPRGRVAALYRKQHLFCANVDGVEVRESELCAPGCRKQLVKIGDFMMGMTMCFDLRFANLFQAYFKKGATLFVVPASFLYQTGQAHWEILLRARAIETLSYVLAPNQTGKNEYGIACWGHSMLISPWGEIIAEASLDKEEIIYGGIDVSKVRRCRQMLPGLADKDFIKK